MLDVGRCDVGRSLLQTGDPVLIDLLRTAIQREGPIPFTRFMAEALYHPEHGYYSSGRAALGREGDYFTSVSVGPLFAQLLAVQFAEMWEMLGRDGDFTLVEQGAHDGQFAHDVLSAAAREHPEFFAALRYRIIEPIPNLRQRQTHTLADFPDKVEWHPALADMPPFRGVHFSNELLDALPVHLLRWTGVEWMERHVTEHEGDFAFVDRPLSDPSLAEQLPSDLPAGYETEVNLAALAWIETLAAKLTGGFVLIADYGWPRAEFFAPQRTTGTLRCYARHQIVPSPFTAIGDTDITAHVEWTSLSEHAAECGLTLAGFTDQHHFLTGLLAKLGDAFASTLDPKSRRALQTLHHPQHLGMKFQYLGLAKGVDSPLNLSGFRFARGAALALA